MMGVAEAKRVALSYNDLWAIAYEYAMNLEMPAPRAKHFADDFAYTFENMQRQYIASPRAFKALRGEEGHHYHDEDDRELEKLGA